MKGNYLYSVNANAYYRIQVCLHVSIHKDVGQHKIIHRTAECRLLATIYKIYNASTCYVSRTLGTVLPKRNQWQKILVVWQLVVQWVHNLQALCGIFPLSILVKIKLRKKDKVSIFLLYPCSNRPLFLYIFVWPSRKHRKYFTTKRQCLLQFCKLKGSSWSKRIQGSVY